MTALHSILRRVVRNDAIRVDPPEVYNWRVVALAASVSTIHSAGISSFKSPRTYFTIRI